MCGPDKCSVKSRAGSLATIGTAEHLCRRQSTDLTSLQGTDSEVTEHLGINPTASTLDLNRYVTMFETVDAEILLTAGEKGDTDYNRPFQLGNP